MSDVPFESDGQCLPGTSTTALAQGEEKFDLAVAFVDEACEISIANDAFYRAIQAERTATISLASFLVASYPNQQEKIQSGFDSNSTTRIHLHHKDKPSLHLRINESEDGKRVVQVTTASEVSIEDQNTVYIDPLTGLGNRRLLDRFLRERREHQDTLAVIIMDLDRFKQINDTLGHAIGDRLLQLVAKRIKRTTRPHDTVVRLGGDEFIIVLESDDNSRDSAQNVASRLVEVMSRPFLAGGHQLNIGASAGISILNDDTDSIDDMVRHADLALYAAKDAGRGKYCVFTQSLEQKAQARRELEIHLRRALHLREFELVYQPQVDMPAGDLTGFEALIRWNSTLRDQISPDEFIPVAEETGEIVPIGEWVLETACKEAAGWNNNLLIAVNVSTVQFMNDNFVESVKLALHNSGLAPERLEIEITETVLISKPEQALKQLIAIRDMGISVAMDDFGTGYSSLSYLNNFPISKIKIDRAFVSINPTPKSRALCDAIISLGASLGMKTLAEGVETAEQFSQLSGAGCIAAQGYHISRPLKTTDLDHFISEYNGLNIDTGT